MLTVLPDVVLSVVPVVVVTGVDVLPDVVDAGVVVDPTKSKLPASSAISCSKFPSLWLDLECIPFNSHNSHTVSEFNVARIEQCHDYRQTEIYSCEQSAIESAKHGHVSNLSSC